MDVSGTIEKILCQKHPQIWSVSPDATVYDAIVLMAEKNVGALLVMENERLVGIISERDYSRKVMLRGKTISRTAIVREIMTHRADHRASARNGRGMPALHDRQADPPPAGDRWRCLARRYFDRRPGQGSDLRPKRDARSTARLYFRRLSVLAKLPDGFSSDRSFAPRGPSVSNRRKACSARPTGRHLRSTVHSRSGLIRVTSAGCAERQACRCSRPKISPV